MAISVIPTSITAPFYSQVTSLDGVSYELEFRWNSRDEAWYINIFNTSGTALAYGIRVVTDWPLIRRMTVAERPAGSIIALDTTGTGTMPTLTTLGTVIQLVYIDEDDNG